MTLGSVVGSPSGSSRVSAAISWPLLRATRTFPIAMRLVAISAMIGRSRAGPGKATQTGLVPKRPSRPRPGGALVGDVDEIHRDEAGAGAHLAIGADPADMVLVAQRHYRDT